MDFPAHRFSRLVAPLLASFLALAAAPAPAQESSVPLAEPKGTPTELVIEGGTFSRNGQRVPATLRNVIDAITQRFPRANFTLVATEDVTIVDDVTLRWGRRVLSPNEVVEPPLHGLLVALKAASRHRFNVEGFGPNEFVLSGQRGNGPRRVAEVFKLGPLVAGRSPDSSLQQLINQTEAELAMLTKRYSDKHPRMIEVQEKLEVLKHQQARASRPLEEGAKLLEQIQDVVNVTLERLKVGGPAPEFKYHAGTGLLIVIGSEEAVEITRKVVDALN